MLKVTEKTGSLTAHVSWLMLAKTLAFLFNMALPVLVVRRLNVTEFGVYKQLFLMIATSVSLVQLGFGMSAYYFLPREPERQAAVVFNIFVFNTVVGGLVCGALLFFPALLGTIFRQPGMDTYTGFVALVILLWTVSSPLEIIPIANEEMKLASAVIMSVQLTRTAMYVATVIVFGTVRSLLYAAIVQGIIQAVVLWWYLQSRFGVFWRRLDFSLLRSQLSYAMPLGLAGVLYTVQTDLHSFFVSNRLGAAAFAIYAVGTVQLPLMTLLQEATNAVVIPRVSYLQHINDTREIILLMARATRKLAAVYFPLYALLAVVARELISFVFTKRYVASVPIFLINLTMLLVGILLQDPLFRAYADQRFFLIRVRVLSCVLLVIGLWFGTTRFGPVGTISAVVIVAVTERIITAIRFGRILGVSRRDIPLLSDVGKLALASLAAGLVAAAVRGLLPGAKPLVILLACGMAFAPVYAGAIWFGGVVTLEEKDIVRRKIGVLLARS